MVGIGASAGGLAAFEKFFANMPATTPSGMAFVLVQHLDPKHKSILSELVKKYTEMQVFEVSDGIEIEQNCVYIIPPNKDLALLHGKLHLLEREMQRGLNLPIDTFFRSLAQDLGEEAVCIILSGTGTDGTLGLKEIKGRGGMTMVQDPASADYDGMPRSAIATGMVDYILSPESMPAQLITYINHAFGNPVSIAVEPNKKTIDLLQKIFILIRSHTGHDFSFYKRNTIQRRIERRMVINQIEQLDNYIRYLQQNPLEVDTLFRELLIGVTSFYRNPEAFEVLEKQVLVPLLANLDPSRPFRVWVPACATGEEAYSIAILIHEAAEALKQHIEVQIFATDIDSEAIEKARAGIFPDSIASDVSPERLNRYFHLDPNSNTYHINKSIRDMVVFAIQNIISDPPFSKLDLISCRNLLIYMDPTLQRKVLSLFHYALNPDGYLFLGSSESLGEFADMFKVVDRTWRLFQSIGAPTFWPVAKYSVPYPVAQGALPSTPGKNRLVKQSSVQDIVDKILLAQHTPPCAIITEQAEVIYIHGHTGRYLEPPAGEASLNLIRMAREGLKPALTSAVRKAVTQKIPVSTSNLHVKTNGDIAIIDLLITPIQESNLTHNMYMVVFNEVAVETGDPHTADKTNPPHDQDQRNAELELELRSQQEYMQTIIEELETANEELMSTNEELQSANEELQSTNEELETSKEELQSVNEELTTVNNELQEKITELSQANNDINNLLAGTGVGTVFVDNDLIIQRFTPTATEVINLIKTDTGRPLNHIASKLNYNGLVDDVQSVLNTLVPRKMEVQTMDGRWYLIGILPYRTLENVIDGAVLTFNEITEVKQLQDLSRLAVIVRDSNDAVTMQDLKGNIRAWNPGAQQMYGWSEEEALHMNVRDIVPEDKREEALVLIKRLIRGEEVTSSKVQRLTRDRRILDVWLSVSRLVNEDGQTYAIATTERDLTKHADHK